MTIGGNYPLVNNGIISNLHNFATVRILATSLLNNGTFQLGNGGKIEAGGTIDNLADLGTVINDGTGTLAFTGVYDNTASTLVLSGAPAGLEMGGTIQGGTVTATGANRLTTWRGGTLVLDNVTLNAPTSVKGVMRVAAGQTLAGNADIALDNSASLVGTVGGTFTINNGITLHGRGAIGGSALPLVTAAAITADQPNAELLVAGNGITNTGILRVTSNGILAIGGSFSMSGLGTIVNDGGTLRFAGSLNNDGQTFTNGSPHTWQLGNGGRIVGGTVETLSGHELVVANGSTATLDGVTLNGTVRLGTTTGAKLRVANGVSGSGTILLAGTATTATQIFNPQGNSFLPVVIGEGITIRGGGGTIGGLPTPTTTPDHVVNHGTIQSDAGTTIELIGATLSDGTLSIKHTGRIRSRGNLSFGDGGTLAVEVGGAGAQAVLAITGNLNLSGIDILELSALGGPVVDSVIATYTGTLSGTFDQVTPGFLVDYSANQVRVTAVPEPGAVAVIAMCGSLTCARVRRRPRV
jgi:hypothetical protein